MHIEKNRLTYRLSSGQETSLNLDDLNIAVARIGEVQAVTRVKAPELLATFNKAWRDAAEFMAMARVHFIDAKRKADRVRAVILLDKAPNILRDKGLATARAPGGSEDFRQAVLDTDEEYQLALETADKIEAVIELLRGKQKAVEMAFTSVKKILGEGDIGYTDQNYSAGDKQDDATNEILAQFGRSKY